MTRRIDEEALKARDLELITDFLANELDPAQVAEVRRRLEEEPAFRDFAAPIVAAWNVPPRWQREAVDQAEVVSAWDRFTKLARFKHQRRKSRRRFIIFGSVIMALLLVVPLAIGVFVLGSLGNLDPMRVAPMVPLVMDSGRVMTLFDGTRVSLEPDARLRALGAATPGNRGQMFLEGSATFYGSVDSTTDPTRPGLLTVQTHAGIAGAFGAATIRVSARGDTTDLEVLPLPAGVVGERATRSVGMLMPYRISLTSMNSFFLKPGERGRIVKGERPVKLAASSTVPDQWDTVTTRKRMAALQKSGDAADPLAFWMSLARPISASSRTKLSSGVTVVLDRGARLGVMPDNVAVGPGRVVVVEGGASFTVPQLAPVGRERATIFLVLTRGGILTVPGAAAFKVSARGDTTDVTALALQSDPGTDRPPAVPAVVTLAPAGNVPAPTQLTLAVGQSGRTVRGGSPARLP